MRRTTVLVALGLAAGLGLAAEALRPGAPHATADDSPVTFSNQVVRIFQENCQVCHHPGDIAPFSLVTYDDAAPYAEAIRARTSAREMPPWKPVAGCGEFRDPRGLTDDEIATLALWAETGAPEGDPADLPPPLVFSDGWRLGTPDAEFVTARRGYRVPASRTEDIYRCFSIPADFDADRFITGVEVRPGNRAIVHHVLLFVDSTGISAELDRADPGPGYTCFGGPGFIPSSSLGGWAPGAAPNVVREGTGFLVPRGARIVVQVHYRPNGRDEVDETRIGLHFARWPVLQDALVLPVLNRAFTIPANARAHPVTAAVELPPHVNLTLESIAPHMHLLGKEMQVTATFPDGERRCLIYIDDWDFHWQGAYRYTDPIRLPGGTRVDVVARYDNSELNHNQPNLPPRDVSWGERTVDEMCIAFLGITVDAERREVSSPVVTDVQVSGAKLVVGGEDLLRGALIEIDGRVVRDSKRRNARTVRSRRDWSGLAPPGVEVSVTVLNPDGVRSAPVRFVR